MSPPLPRSLDRAEFVATYGHVFEHSPWIAQAAFERRLTNDRDTELATALAQVERIALLRLKELLP